MATWAEEYITLWQSKNGRWCIYRQKAQGYIVVADEGRTGLSDHPIRYSDGRIAYDRPERIPAYVKKAVARFV